MKNENWVITKWCKAITDNGKDININSDKVKENMIYKFRLLDDDGIIYAYGFNDKIDFLPLKNYREVYGCSYIQYKNSESGVYETL